MNKPAQNDSYIDQFPALPHDIVNICINVFMYEWMAGWMDELMNG